MKPLKPFAVELDGTQLIEASAGTGKTFTIATLYLRLLLEGDFKVDQILVVTFTKAAAAELRQRIRERLREASEVFEARLVAENPASRGADSVLDQLVAGSVERGEPARDRDRLVEALRGFDEAAISTIHGFCDGVLEENAFESGVAFGTELVKNDSLLVAEVVEDYWTRTLFDAPGDFVRWLGIQPSTSARALSKLASAVLSPPGIEVVPDTPTPLGAEIQAAAKAWRQAFEAAGRDWQASGPDAVELVVQCARQKILKNGSYPQKPVVESVWPREVDDVLARPIPGRATFSKDGKAFDSKFMKFTRQEIEGKTAKKSTPPEHPIFESFQRFAEADMAYAELLAGEWLNRRIELVAFVRAEWVRRQTERRTRTFDRLLTDFVTALEGEWGEALKANVLQRYPVALIDEFQDTDPTQYKIFDRIWGTAPGSLFMIGDPKQAIYGFRGADIFAYIDAKRGAEDRAYTLDRNWRSDRSLIDGVNCIFTRGPSPFLFDEIPFHEAQAAPGATEKMRAEEGAGAPLRFLLLERDDDPKRGEVQSAKRLIPQAIVADIARLLVSGARIGPESGESDSPGRSVGAGDVAILCRTKVWARDLSLALNRQGIPNVVRGDDSVFDTPEAEDFLALLSAAANPSDPRALRAALCTSLLGFNASALEELRESQDAWEKVLGAARDWQACWGRGGAIALLQKIFRDYGAQGRLLAWAGGERQLTNLLHLAELVQKAGQGSGMGPLALHAWLQRMRIDARSRDSAVLDDALIRLESDAHSVQILTIHGSKGLQYPIVYCPDLWDGSLLKTDDKVRPRFHDPGEDHRLKLDIGSPEQATAANRMRWESLAENRRLLYVALTRAEHRLVVVWGGFRNAGSSALGLLLHPAPGAEDFPAEASDKLEDLSRKHVKAMTDEEFRTDLAFLVEASGGAISVETLSEAPGPQLPRTVAQAGSLEVRRGERKLSSRWGVSSFSGLVARASGHWGGGRTDSHPASQGFDYDDAPEALPTPGIEIPLDAPPVLLHGFPKGAGPGTMIHQVFESIDFSLPDSPAFEKVVDSGLARHGLPRDQAPTLCAGIRQTLATPLGGPLADFSLGQLAGEDRVDEMEFTLPVSRSGLGPLTAGALADAFEAHASEPHASKIWAGEAGTSGYGARIRGLGFAPLQGHLRGFIDLTFRRDGRFYLVDYKSNHLGNHAEHYGQEALRSSMEEHDYVLQYHLYAVALHRHLTRRLPGYDFETHMGGAYYLFLRGMSPDAPRGCGIFYDRPSRSLIEALSACLGEPEIASEGSAA